MHSMKDSISNLSEHIRTLADLFSSFENDRWPFLHENMFAYYCRALSIMQRNFIFWGN